MAEVIKYNFTPDFINEGKKIVEKMTEHDSACVWALVAYALLLEIKKGIAGEEEGMFYQEVDKLYDEITPHGCWFCDPTVDINEIKFDPNVTGICLNCSHKLAQVAKAFGWVKEEENGS